MMKLEQNPNGKKYSLAKQTNKFQNCSFIINTDFYLEWTMV